MSHVISLQELQQHHGESGAPWVAVRGVVYDVTKFSQLHPGGDLVLRRACGKDATVDFEIVHHPKVLGTEQYRRLRVGVLEKSDAATDAPNAERLSISAPYTDHYWLTPGLKAPPFYTPAHFELLRKVRSFYEKEIIPFAAKWDEDRTYPNEIHRKAYDAGIYGLMWPQQYGGTPPAGWDAFMGFILFYETARAPSGGFQASFASITIALPPIIKHGSHELKERVARPLIEGRAIGALCITEPWAGSDVSRIRSRASRDGNHYVVNGEKKFITNGMKADFLTVAVRTAEPKPTDPFFGLSLLVIEAKTPGVDRRRMNTQGWWGSNTTYITFEDVRVPIQNLIGEENQGFRYIMSNFNTERFMMCVGCVAACHKLIAESIRYAAVRQTFGQRLLDRQVIRHKIADMSIKTEALYAQCEQICMLMDGKANDLDVAPKIALCKVLATKTFELCAREASQVFGGASCQRKGGQGELVERFYRDVRVQAIGGGSEEILMDLAVRMSKL